MNTSHSGHSESPSVAGRWSPVDGIVRPPLHWYVALPRTPQPPSAPGAFLMRLVARREPFPVAWTIALHHRPELVPIDLAKVPVFRRLIVLEHRVGERQPDGLCLRDRQVHEALAQLVVAF